MTEKVIVGFIGAALALLIREALEYWKTTVRRKRIAALCCEHLKKIREDLQGHVELHNGNAKFSETQYSEVAVGDFLYELITSNIDCFGKVDSVRKTINFFHHYMVNMSTIRSRIDGSTHGTANLTEATYEKLLEYLDDAIDELQLAST
ncbi:hypothetical protein GCM10011533_37290 [Streptosporangium jomthongense]|uniref:Abortive infection protein-like C-terminal domain-containing protein n=1 Tax=Marinobacter aromaticivorans TaxID=1494078 RepID=A0ABW2IZU7_9GAMM|nr:hypothetical protein [Marinobacter aromaticivorans]GGE81374.1 hypothetical protein GCM10011533_37290 [Streptosporangium jomthongense]